MMPTSASTEQPIQVCVIHGQVMRVNGGPCAYATVTFNSSVPQNVAGQIVQPLIVSSSTDEQGELAEIALAQGLLIQVYVSDDGVTYPPMATLVPMADSATFSELMSP